MPTWENILPFHKTYEPRGGTPYISPTVVDRLAYLLPHEQSLEEEDRWMPSALTAFRDAIATRRCEPWFGGPTSYMQSGTFVGPSGGRCLIQIGAKNRNQRGGVRMELNPNKLSEDDVAAIHAFMREILGASYDEVRGKSLVNRMDLAADIVNIFMNDLLIEYKHSQLRTVVSKHIRIKDSRVESVRFGGFSSAYAAVVYDKQTEQLDKLVRKIAGKGNAGSTTSLKQQSVSQLKLAWGQPAVTRVEIRCEKLGGVPLAKLLHLENRFERFKVWDTTFLKDVPDPFRSAVRSMCRDLGVKAALAKFVGHKKYDALKDILDSEASWWEPKDLWSLGIDCLRDSKLFPRSAFHLASA